MGRQAKHHFIPCTYLKEFTEGGQNISKFIGVPINNNETFPTSPQDSCSRRDYYSVEHENTLLIEQWYSNEIEPKIGVILNIIKEKTELPSSINDKEYLYLLLATLYLRTPSFRASIEAPMRRTKEIVDSISSDIKVSNKHEFNYSKTDLIMTELSLLDTVVQSLSKKYYQLYVINDSKFDVITSDTPFILSHPNGGNNFYFGLDTPMVEICVPITRKIILLARNEQLLEGTFEADDKLIGLTNTKLIRNAERFFYSSKPEMALIDDDFNVYTHKLC